MSAPVVIKTVRVRSRVIFGKTTPSQIERVGITKKI